MGNGISKNTCFSGETYAPAVSSDPVPGDIHGQSFKYVPIVVAFDKSPMANMLSSKTPFLSLFGAAINANQATSSSIPSFRLLNELMVPQSSVCTIKSSCSSAAAPVQDQPTRLSFSDHFLDSSGTVSTISNQLSRRPFMSGDGDHRSPPSDNVQWAQGMAGEDRFQVAVSEECGWVFVGIYDGFLGPDATDYLFANLHVAVNHTLKGVLSDNIQCNEPTTNSDNLFCLNGGIHSPEFERKPAKRGQTEHPEKNNSAMSGGSPTIHQRVLRALGQALRETEEAFFKAAEEGAADNPEIGLMGSCVLVMLMKGENVYVMNVGNSRAVLARRPWPNLNNILGKATEKDLQQLKAEIMDGLQPVQLNAEHSTSVEEEVKRIKAEHNDSNAIIHGRVKGKLNITRAFGAGYLKEPKWNSMLLASFKIDYIGKDPYINCIPSLHHHCIGPNDKFLVLSSDGLYQYFTNKEVVDKAEMFTTVYPKGNPAEHLIKEVLLRAARKAGMDYHELLKISHDERRKYHDDISVMVISFKGRMGRSSV
ncbi:probable protein phosphatase 2C 31 isoform X2 [Triticum dicoccoides]|uniref:probable protein phosphatase 2C 31 isoform X2 n=1 Tax=Triticum dicoccoides TaxID=85692 RepID=UPI000E7BBDEE|nr:probable protein phosphatase 2C 31 isoform X2 [Triticum dicoccoides]